MFSRKNVHVYANCVKLVTSILISFAQRAKPASFIYFEHYSINKFVDDKIVFNISLVNNKRSNYNSRGEASNARSPTLGSRCFLCEYTFINSSSCVYL